MLRIGTAAAAALLTASLAAPAHADDVTTAQAQVQSLQAKAVAATAALLQGTQAWEADVHALHVVQVQLGSAQKHVTESESALAAQQLRMARVARGLYMHPTPPTLQIAFNSGPDQVLELLQVRRTLDIAAGADAQVLRDAQVARLRLSREQARVGLLAKQAQQLTERSASRMRDLQDLAQRTARALDDAQAALSHARAAKAERLRIAAARFAALRAAQGGALCTSRSTAGQSNGNLDPASLCPLWQAPGQRLVYGAANAFNAMSKFHAASQGTPLCVTDSYRSYSQQVEVYRTKPGLAAVPGTSEHGWGRAVDLGCGVQSFGSAAHQWMRANAPRFGFVHPAWAEPSGSKPEPWHWEFSR